ncbi:hypothetical protein A3F65_01675 [Candidatus Saccharibacteria bacterium RIFCSPHIGHO2_12_FULL_47_16b]|nr:MAG: hypothetical protein A3F65_01675 [Candidatus Saccharibacteria bacterium RIFCSPHIGHO2_12_FULL_47_16b]
MANLSGLTRKIKRFDAVLVGLALLALVVLALAAGFSDSVSLGTYTKVAFVLVAIVALKTYFGWLAMRLGIVFVASAVILGGGVAYLQRPQPVGNLYQAVFLTNGQVYFGHLKNADTKSPVLTDIYYLQSTPQNPQQSGDQQTQPQLSLIKLGKELHGPQDKMVLRADQILFWENLNNDSKVVQTINQSKQQGQ